ncbi:5-oxoprolinase subunit PxpB [Pontibacter beigongshangensis]|uniref:5-oxoprolinase subunit PxpB n=1 Tax=Pontibacter beigongshangensis TaxID=2574733 RepID=UPI001650C8F5|nr:5-oxoprolinase subunit PxpB [Pontibacter beigongshangensis]
MKKIKAAHAFPSAYQLFPLGDAAIVVQFGDKISLEVHKKVRAFAALLDENTFEGFVELVPAFRTVTVYYNPWQVSQRGQHDPYQAVIDLLLPLLTKTHHQEEQPSRLVEIPVCYGGEFGPDLEFVATHNHLSPEMVISLHAATEYLVYMIGFAPGFPYLGGMNRLIAAPRHGTPRAAIPPGSVGIAGNQTGVYPLETPGGWQLIGRTPLPLFQPHHPSPCLLKAGDRLRFVPITQKEFLQRKEQVHESVD